MLSYRLLGCNSYTHIEDRVTVTTSPDMDHGGYIGFDRSLGIESGLFYDFYSFDNHYIYYYWKPPTPHLSFEEARSVLEAMDGFTILGIDDRIEYVYKLSYTDELSDNDVYLLAFNFEVLNYTYTSEPVSSSCCS